MFLPNEDQSSHQVSICPRRDGNVLPRWTIVLAFYNEESVIGETLRQLVTQTRAFRLILVDNGSTDNSVARCHEILALTRVDYVIVAEAEVAGQTAALERGLALVKTELVATCDADTYYPSTYLASAENLFDSKWDVSVVGAYYLQPDASFVSTTIAAFHQVGAFRLLPRQGHVGAAGQAFRMASLRAAGGYSHKRWPYLMGDHEIIHQVLRQGRQRMSFAHWCGPSTRRGVSIRWSLIERVAYHLTPYALKDRYFGWLAKRFERREMFATRLRQRDWAGAEQ